MRVFYKFSNTIVSLLLAFVFQTFSDNVLFAVAGKIKFNLQKMSVNFSQHRPRCLKCDLHKVREHKHRDVDYIKDFYGATKPF